MPLIPDYFYRPPENSDTHERHFPLLSSFQPLAATNLLSPLILSLSWVSSKWTREECVWLLYSDAAVRAHERCCSLCSAASLWGGIMSVDEYITSYLFVHQTMDGSGYLPFEPLLSIISDAQQRDQWCLESGGCCTSSLPSSDHHMRLQSARPGGAMGHTQASVFLYYSSSIDLGPCVLWWL